jgi:hypothetical protein
MAGSPDEFANKWPNPLFVKINTHFFLHGKSCLKYGLRTFEIFKKLPKEINHPKHPKAPKKINHPTCENSPNLVALLDGNVR